MINNILALILISLSIYFILTEFMHCKECFQNYLGSSTRCFDCEEQYPDDQKWKGQPSKCFDCDKELSNNIKCFDCMKEQRPLEHMNNNLVQ